MNLTSNDKSHHNVSSFLRKQQNYVINIKWRLIYKISTQLINRIHQDALETVC